MTAFGPSREELAAALSAIVDRLPTHREPADGPVLRAADPALLARLRADVPAAAGRPLMDAVDDLLGAVYPHRARTDHPRFFAFIPSPASPVSWIGDLLTAAHNPHAGSWLQSAGPGAIEAGLVDWFAAQIGFPDSSGGLFVSGGSMANLTALVAARDHMLGDDRRSAVAYASSETHASIAKGLRIAGFLDGQIRMVPVDGDRRMDAAALAREIERDILVGLTPFAVVATAGTTNTGAIDPLDAIADVCAAHDLWMHVDGAYGASIALSPERRGLLAGIERADSLSWDAHKWLFQTYGCGLVLVRDRARLLASFRTGPDYLRDAEFPDGDANFWDLGPEMTRPARALKLWLTLQAFGTDAVAAAIEHGFRLAEWAEDEVRATPGWAVVTPARLAIVTFRYAPEGMADAACDALNIRIARRLLEDGFAVVGTTRLSGRTVLRICAIHPAATEADMRETIRRLDRLARSTPEG